MEENVKLTKLAQVRAKVGAGVLARCWRVSRSTRIPICWWALIRATTPRCIRYRTSWRWCRRWTFPPIADDPLYLRPDRATNALSDIYAMGGDPKLALNIMCVPEDMPKDTVHQILRGGYEKRFMRRAPSSPAATASSTTSPKYGLSVTGLRPSRQDPHQQRRKEWGDVLLLTKPIGIGILTSAMKADLCPRRAQSWPCA